MRTAEWMQRLEAQKDAILAEVGGWPAELQRWRPADGGWSALQVLDHLVRTEAGISAVARVRLAMPQRITVRDRVGFVFVEHVFRSRRRVRVPGSVANVIAPGEGLAPWAPGEAPVVARGSDIKLAALSPPSLVEKEGQSIAAKGVVTGDEAQPMSPAARLKLDGAARARAEKCLADAVYFESRDEPVRAQIGVAQVVLNRVFSPFYPKTVCGVVYQNAGRHLACQFTFACDGKPDIVTEPDAWERAKKIARDTLDGKLWMPDVAKSTHYHDWWARPNWIGEMRRMDRLGGLIFYRPRNWGDGADEPRWGDARTTAKEAAILNKM